MSYIDTVARLLAIENLSILRLPVRTASFDVKLRVLRLPILKGMTPVIEDMMVVHEVGHAKFTPLSMLEDHAKVKYLPFYINVVEDVRIERFMKLQYPGTRKTFLEAYRELGEMNFFGTRKKKPEQLNKYSLINKINLYYKLGPDLGIVFLPEEQDFADRCAKTNSADEVIQLAKEILAYQKATNKKKLKEAEQSQSDDDTDANKPEKKQKGPIVVVIQQDESETDPYDDGDDADDDGLPEDVPGSGDDDADSGTVGATGESDDDNAETDDDDAKGGGSGKDDDADEDDADSEGDTASGASKAGTGGLTDEEKKDILEDGLKVVTQETFDEALKDKVDTSTSYQYKKLDLDYSNLIQIVPYKQVIQETGSLDPMVTSNITRIRRFKESMNLNVGYMLKQFEMKKSADLMRRATVSKSGSLDMGKVYAYQIKDDLFKRMTILPEGKNHGMVFLLDWSLSMAPYIDQTIEQMINLAAFCRRAQIPFTCLAFTSDYRSPWLAKSTSAIPGWYSDDERAKQGKVQQSPGNFKLLELLSSKMRAGEYNTMVDRLLTRKIHGISKEATYTLGGTPLNEAMLFMIDFVPRFKQMYGIDKMTFVALTDGEGTELRRDFPPTVMELDENGTYVDRKVKHFLRDSATQRDYQIESNSEGQTRSLTQILQHRSGIRTIGFHITNVHGSSIEKAITNHSKTKPSTNKMVDLVYTARNDFQSKGSYCVPNSAHNLMVLLPSNGMAIKDDDTVINSDMDSQDVADVLTKSMIERRSSRILLDKFIQEIA